MRTHPIPALLLLGLLLAPVLSPRPAEAAAATVTYAITGGTYFDAFFGGPVVGGSVTVNLSGVTVIPSVSASWTSASITGFTWATPFLPRTLGLASFPFVPAAGMGSIGGFGSFFLPGITGPQTLYDPFFLTRPISVFSGMASGFFTGFGGGVGGASLFGTDFAGPSPWSLTFPFGSLTEVSSSITIVPEPGTGLLVGLGLAGLGISGGRLRRLRRTPR